MKFKYHRWFQALVVPLVALAFHIFFDLVHRNVSGTFNKCLNILIPGTKH